MVSLIAAMFFTVVILRTKAKLDLLYAYALKAAKRLFGIPGFRYCVIADGIREILIRFPQRQIRSPTQKTDEQPLLFIA